MKEDLQTAATISVFSARLFYSSSLHASAQSGSIHHSVNIPQRGMTKAPAPSGGSCTLVWMDGLAVQASRVRGVVDTLRRGEIPKTLAQPSSMPAHVRVRYLSPTNIALCGDTLASTLALVGPLLQAVESCRHRSCEMCGNTLAMYHSATNLTEEILEAHRGQRIEIQLRASPDLLALWGEPRGFRLQESVDGTRFIELDSLLAQGELFERVRRALESCWSIPNMYVWCVGDEFSVGYAPHGFCSTCRKVAPAVSPGRLSHILQRGSADSTVPELLLNVCGTTVANILTSSLSELEERLLIGGILSPELRDALWEFKLHTLPLGRTTDTLSATTLAHLAVITAAFDNEVADSLILLDIPRALLSRSDTSRADRWIERSSRNRGVVVLGTHDESLAPVRLVRTPQQQGTILGRLRLRAPQGVAWRELDILQGERYVIIPGETSSTEPLASYIFAALSDNQTTSLDVAQWSQRHACEPHVIDIRPVSTSHKRIFAQDCALYESLTKLYASGLEARMRGLTPKDFNLSSRSKPNYVCPECSGLGVILETVSGFERPQAHPCLVCLGTRFRAPVRDIEFRGRPLWRLLNSTFSEQDDTLRALPRVGKVLSLLALLGLNHLPIGMPTCLLSFSERRLTALARSIISASTTRPPLLIIEEPFAGLSSAQTDGLIKLISNHALGKDVTLLFIMQSYPREASDHRVLEL